MHIPWRHEYFAIGDALNNRIDFNSVIDFGCGNGYIIARLKILGKEVAGFEGSVHALETAPDDIRIHVKLQDVTRPVSAGFYDLVVCSEVAEHIPVEFSDALVDNICRSAKLWIFFSAAIPGQGGYHHVNEKPHSYWIEKFKKRRFGLQQDLTLKLRSDFSQIIQSIWWFTQNAMIFYRERT